MKSSTTSTAADLPTDCVQLNCGLPLRCVALDAVGTLIFPDPPVRRVYFEAAERHGSRLTETEIDRRFGRAYQRLEEQTQIDLRTSESLETERWRTIVAEVLSDVRNPDACFQELFDWFAAPTSWRVYPDAPPAIARLTERGIPCAVASNFDRRLHSVLAGLPPLESITLRIISAEIGYRKPAGEFYRSLSEQSRVPANQIAMVGDSRSNDFEGARQAGLHAIWIDRHRPCDSSRVQNLMQAVDWLIDSGRINRPQTTTVH